MLAIRKIIMSTVVALSLYNISLTLYYATCKRYGNNREMGWKSRPLICILLIFIKDALDDSFLRIVQLLHVFNLVSIALNAPRNAPSSPSTILSLSLSQTQVIMRIFWRFSKCLLYIAASCITASIVLSYFCRSCCFCIHVNAKGKNHKSRIFFIMYTTKGVFVIVAVMMIYVCNVLEDKQDVVSDLLCLVLLCLWAAAFFYDDNDHTLI